LNEGYLLTWQDGVDRYSTIGLMDGALSFSQSFLSKTNEYNLLKGNYQKDQRASCLNHPQLRD